MGCPCKERQQRPVYEVRHTDGTVTVHTDLSTARVEANAAAGAAINVRR
jgi:hypothetical protein